jgi:hypothetical protein
MAGSWIRFTRPDGAAMLLCEESGVTLSPWPPRESGATLQTCRLSVGAGGEVREVVGDIDSFALALGARSVP